MPLTRVDGDFTQISNVVLVTTPAPPTNVQQILIGFLSGETWLVDDALTSADQSGTVDLGLGYSLGYTKNADSSILGSYGQALEGSSAGAARSTNFSFTWDFEGAPIYSNAATRQTRVAFGNGLWVMVGTRTTGAPSGATSTDFGNDGFTWSSISAALSSAVGNTGIAGIDFVAGQFYIYTNDGQIARSDDGSAWEVVATGGPSESFVSNSANPYARFAELGNTIVGMFCGRIVVSADGGNTWNMTDFVDAFCDTNLVGGPGFADPVMFGLAAGDGAFIAVGDVAGSDVDGVITFIAADIAGAGGSAPGGWIQFTCDNFVGNPTTATPSGTWVSGTLAGTNNVGVCVFNGSGREISIAIQLPTADLPGDPENGIWTEFEIPGITSGPIASSDNFQFDMNVVGSNTQCIWRFGGIGFFPLFNNGDSYTITFTPVSPLPGSPTPRIRRSTVGAEATWADVTVPGSLSSLFDAIFDESGNRFLLLGQSVEFTPGLSGGEFTFDPGDAQGSGWAGSVAEGVATLFTSWSFVTGSQAEPCGNFQFGDIAGYPDLALIRTGELGGQWLLMMHVPEDELRPLPQSDYFEEITIPLLEGQIGPFAQEDATFNTNFDVDQGVYELAWLWFDSAGFAGENDLTATLTPSITFEGGTTVTTFHVLQSVDAGVTFTDEVQQAYAGADPDKGWITLIETPPPSFNLLQENDFAVLQEDDFNILVSDDPPVAGPPVLDTQPNGITQDLTWTSAAPIPGVDVVQYVMFRITAQELDGQINFIDTSQVTHADLQSFASFSANINFTNDADANNLTAQYAYFVRAELTAGDPLDSNIVFSSAVS